MMPSLILLAALAGPTQEAEPAPAPAPAVAAAPAAAEAAPGEATDKGLALLKRGRYRSARAALEQAVAANPQSAAAQFYLGYALYKIAEPTRRLSKEKEEAAQHFAACFAIDPGFRPDLGRPAR
jgi:tetratricopeptide (TPR) repeat protein